MNGKKVVLVTAGLFCSLYIIGRLLNRNNGYVISRLFGRNHEHGQLIPVSSPRVVHESSMNFDTWFKRWSPVMANLSKAQTAAGNRLEGHIWTEDENGFNRIPQLKAYYNHVLSRRSEIRRICETGFNGGHSTMMWTSLFNGDVSMVVFDMCVQQRCTVGEREIRKYFPGADLTIVRGDSRITIPSFARAHPDVKCDFFSVDGGHSGNVPVSDIQNFLQMAKKSSTMVLDDVNSKSAIDYVKNVGHAWGHAIAQNWVTPQQPCEYCFRDTLQNRYDHKFCLGKYNPK